MHVAATVRVVVYIGFRCCFRLCRRMAVVCALMMVCACRLLIGGRSGVLAAVIVHVRFTATVLVAVTRVHQRLVFQRGE